MMRRALPILAIALLGALWAAPARGADAEECQLGSPVFGICALDAIFASQPEDLPLQAGSHPRDLTVELAVNTEEIPVGVDGEPEIIPTEEVKDLFLENPPGLVGTPTPGPRCSSADFIVGGSITNCPVASALGTAEIEFQEAGFIQTLPVYNLYPAPGVAAKIGFVVENVAPVTVDLTLNPEPPHNVVANITNVTQVRYFFSSSVTLWGVPAAKAHDSERGACLTKGGFCPAGVPEIPFLTLPTQCEESLRTRVETDSWQDPGDFVEEEAQTATPPTGCDKLAFEPEVSSQATTEQAGSPTGLEFQIDVNDKGLTSPTGYAASTIKKTVVALPEGVTANPSLAEGLDVCTPSQYEAEGLDGQGCPQGAKVGTVEVETPLLEGVITRGSVFIAQPYRNPFDSLLALYIVLREPQRGVFVKLAGQIEPDPVTGQLVTTVEDIPQVPFSEFRFRFREGARSPLITPNECGEHRTEILFTPWARPAKPLEVASSFEITSGVGGGPCPSAGTPPFEPGFSAGTLGANAKAYSPFYARLTRRDGDQDMTRFSFVLPPGLAGNLSGISRCGEAGIAAARAKSGKEEQAEPSCPANSQIGTVLGGAGVGSQLTYVPGSLYLAGPVGSAPLSIVAIVPAVAGPFDVGNVVTRVALKINPITAQVEVDGDNSEPLPHILAGIPLRVRDVRVSTDRPNFTFNPTDCQPKAISGRLWGGGANPFSTLDDSPVSLASRFQAVNCARLGFRPKLAIRLRGGTRRGGHPALRAVLSPRSQDANFQRAVVTLPRSAFLDQAHIRTICTRVQFAAGAGNGAQCPPRARYGYARAWSPILDHPAQGPVFLRSSDNNLPDLVVALQGPPEAAAQIELSARIDSQKGGIRTTFTGIPDLPVSRFVLNMQGGKKGLIVNSTDLCARARRAHLNMRAQNNRRLRFAPKVVPTGCKQRRARKSVVSHRRG